MGERRDGKPNKDVEDMVAEAIKVGSARNIEL